MNASARRLFLGLLPDDAVRDALVAHRRLWQWRGGRPTAPERLHLTLHFLDLVDAAQERDLREMLAGEALAPFDLVLHTPELWAGRTAVLRPDPHPALAALHARLSRHVAAAGLAASRLSFKPHVTLARDAQGAAAPRAATPILWTVRDFALIWSRLDAPPRYELVARYGAA